MFTAFQQLLLSVLSGILLSLPWQEGIPGFFILIALIPLLILENSYVEKTDKSFGLFWYTFICFFIWNGITTWWIAYATSGGAITLLVFNSLLYTTVFWIYHISRKKLRINKSLLLIVFWLAFEYVYLRSEFSWPWFSLGHALADSVKLIQWYEFTGTLGGTLWVLAFNLTLYKILTNYSRFKTLRFAIKHFAIVVLMIIPAIYSVIRYNTYTETADRIKIMVIQPNIDPYGEKFEGLNPQEQLQIILNETSKTAQNDIDLFVGPETAVQGHLSLENLPESWAVKKIQSYLKDFPDSRFLIGAETRTAHNPGEKLPAFARIPEGDTTWYTYYNSALQIDTSSHVQIYHKSQLVSGVEKMPFSRYLSFLQSFPVKLGGTFGSLGYQDHRTVFYGKTGVAPVICFESVYGQFVTDYVKEGAGVICIITNDGWWKNSSGISQHLNLARLRAIETRRSVARSANTGISAFINQKGDIIKSLSWGKRGTLTDVVNTNSHLTFYVKHGDLLGEIALFLSIGLVAWFFYLKFGKR